ncbi:hypothetical protein CHARACLAT_022571 [Characodon lateralis]|uniref:Uncharacterized protein n=1 Tax=Characodon lateralis TaxID=208331 RepID=A0ABU7DIX6_9TELE|nr:hypothetical protein [Characodon lateralis]
MQSDYPMNKREKLSQREEMTSCMYDLWEVYVIGKLKSSLLHSSMSVCSSVVLHLPHVQSNIRQFKHIHLHLYGINTSILKLNNYLPHCRVAELVITCKLHTAGCRENGTSLQATLRHANLKLEKVWNILMD